MKSVYLEEPATIALEKSTCFTTTSSHAEESFTLCFVQDGSCQEVYNLSIDDLRTLHTMLGRVLEQEKACHKLIDNYNIIPNFASE